MFCFIACPAGYFGSNCGVPCLYPAFGQFCTEECNCGQSECNHVHGCKIDGKNLFKSMNAQKTRFYVSNKENFKHKNICLTIMKISGFHSNVLIFNYMHRRDKTGHIQIYQKHVFNQHLLLNYSMIQTLILLKFLDLMLLHGL